MIDFFDKTRTVEIYNQALAELPFLKRLKVRTICISQALGSYLLKALFAVGVFKKPVLDDGVEALKCEFGYRGNGDGHFLSAEEVEAFEQNGYVAPFKVLEHDDAIELGKVLEEKIKEGRIVYGNFPELEGEERRKKLEQEGLRDDVEARCWNRHFNIPEMMDLLERPEITDRMASIVGEDVRLWRSQVFPVGPKSHGSALHQVTDFSASTSGRELVPLQPMPNALLNLSVWIALTDVDENNAAMVMTRGSHQNGRFEQVAHNGHYYYCQLDLRSKFQISLIRTISNSPLARFDVANVFYSSISKRLPFELIDQSKITTMRMKAGEAIIFTSKCVHGSHPNNSETNQRFAVGGRYTSAMVDVYPDDEDYYETNHFLPHQPLLDKRYLKAIPVRKVKGSGGEVDEGTGKPVESVPSS